MPSPTRLKRSLVSNKSSASQQKPTDVRLSPEASSPEKKLRPSEPYPIPSNNPASQYTLLEKLGTGSFGTVYKAIHNDTKQIVAVKQIGNGPIPRCFRFSRVWTDVKSPLQISKTPMTIYPKSSKKSPISLNATRNT